MRANVAVMAVVAGIALGGCGNKKVELGTRSP
jgi:hypothetical protein